MRRLQDRSQCRSRRSFFLHWKFLKINATNPALAQSVLSPAEYAAGQNSVGVARMQYGNAMERLFWRAVDQSGTSGAFQRLGGPSRADGIVSGQLFDITTTNPITVQRHFGRPYGGPNLKFLQYVRPATFTTSPEP